MGRSYSITGGNLNDHSSSLLNNGSEECLLLVHSPGCGHCKAMAPEWKKLEALNGTKMNNKTVEVKAVNCEGSEVEKEVANDLGVEGYPTIKVMTKNNVEDYNGARDEASIKNHLETVANQN